MLLTADWLLVEDKLALFLFNKLGTMKDCKITEPLSTTLGRNFILDGRHVKVVASKISFSGQHFLQSGSECDGHSRPYCALLFAK